MPIERPSSSFSSLQLVAGTGWLIGASLVGCFIVPMFYMSGTTHGPAIDIGVAWNALCGSVTAFVIVFAVQFFVAKMRFSLLRVFEIMSAASVLAMLLQNYIGALEQFEASESRFQERVQQQLHSQLEETD